MVFLIFWEVFRPQRISSAFRTTAQNKKGFWWLLFLRIFSSIQAHMVQRTWSSPFRTGTMMLALSFHLQKHHSYFAPCSWFHPGWPWCQAISVARTVREQCFLEARKGFRWLRRHWHFGLGSSAVWSLWMVQRSKEDSVRKSTLPTLSTQLIEQWCSSCMSRSCSVGRFGINGFKKSFWSSCPSHQMNLARCQDCPLVITYIYFFNFCVNKLRSHKNDAKQ